MFAAYIRHSDCYGMTVKENSFQLKLETIWPVGEAEGMQAVPDGKAVEKKYLAWVLEWPNCLERRPWLDGSKITGQNGSSQGEGDWAIFSWKFLESHKDCTRTVVTPPFTHKGNHCTSQVTRGLEKAEIWGNDCPGSPFRLEKKAERHRR